MDGESNGARRKPGFAMMKVDTAAVAGYLTAG